eukprot:CAMPEP_0182903938 /NCGR_PEP_ID=MMETSP0034_2-20130328/31731_1 /TAXON_ID=156128 /ORGANISM="Nephroselmis pyriformis, Strain CCMP717" /LENGTH=44 /DNA_ID= /DNA_START= /DNA_END= /DNA_ORIENTATION=
MARPLLETAPPVAGRLLSAAPPRPQRHFRESSGLASATLVGAPP